MNKTRTQSGLIVILLISLLASCSPSKEKRIARINDMEKNLFAPENTNFNKEKADSLTDLYEAFIKDFPQDTLAPGYLFKAANLAMNSGDGSKALTLFDQYIAQYPDQPKAGMSLFFKGFIYENVLMNLDKARETYLLFIEKYPADEFADDAQMAIQNLGKTPEMMIQEFEARQRADSARIADSIASSGKKKTRK
jgi:outer membrane protein assembly factor BamD (BamD/ComL family)